MTAQEQLEKLAEEHGRFFGYNGGFYPFAFNVKTHGARFDAETLAPMAAEHSTDATPERVAAALAGMDENRLGDMALEGAQRDLLDSDCYQPDSGRRVEWGLMGRSGGWAVMLSYNGYSLKDERYFEEFEDEHADDLRAFVERTAGELTPDAAARAVEWAAAFVVALECEDAAEEDRAAAACERIMRL